MKEFDILTIDKNGITMVFNYFDSEETASYKATLICSNINEAYKIIREFKRKQETMYLNAYKEYLKKAKEDKKLTVVQTLYSAHGKSTEITIFDEPQEIISKYSEFFGKKLTDEEKVKALKHFDHIVHMAINDNLVKAKGKTK